jgi:cell division septal protein FtsQ
MILRRLRRSLPVAGVSVPSDPHFRRSDASVARRRPPRTWRRLALRWGVPLAGLGVLAVIGARGLVASGLLRVREIVIVGNERLSIGDVESLVAGLGQEQIFDVDLEAYRRRLLDSPWVADVHLTRVLPATIRIAVVERQPFAAARVGQQLYLVDKTGSIIGDYGPAHGDRDLPVVNGLATAGRDATPVIDQARAGLAAAFVEAVAPRPDLASRVSEVDVSRAEDVVVMLNDDQAWLHMGNAGFVERLDRYLEARVALVDRFGRLDYVDLRFGERVFLRALDRGRLGPVANAARGE